MFVLYVYFFFFKQKTAYEMRISDWSSDVCSSDLPRPQLESQLGDGPAADRIVVLVERSDELKAIAAHRAAAAGVKPLVRRNARRVLAEQGPVAAARRQREAVLLADGIVGGAVGIEGQNAGR